MTRPLSRFEWGALALILLGVVARAFAFWYRQLDTDPYWYVAMAESVLRHGEFLIPWVGPDVHTHHFPPAFPLLLAAAFALGGTSVTTAVAAGFATGLFTIGVALFTTWDLYGRARGLAVAAIVACFTTLVQFDRWVLSESLVVAFFALTIWGILKSLDKPPFILAAGVFAGLGYLTKASMGPFFLLAGAGGFAWRFYYVRWQVFRDRWYMGAAAVFAACVLPWAYRNGVRHGWSSWETQPAASRAISGLFSDPAWPLIVLGEAAWSLVILAIFALPFLPEVWSSRKRIREERTSALWLAVVTPTVVALFFIAAFYHAERWGGLLHLANFRYLVTPLIPLLWLGVRDVDLDAALPAGRPAAGGDLIQREAWLAAGGVGLAAFVIGTDVAGPYLSTLRFMILYVAVAAGLALVLLSRGSSWTAVQRVAKDGASWRAVPAPPASGHAGVAIIALVVGILGALFVSFQLFPLVAAGALAVGLATPRARVLGLAALLLAGSLVHYNAATGVETVAAEVNARAQPGDRVATNPSHEQEIWPYLDERLVAVRAQDPHEWLVELGRRGEPRPPENYTTVATRPIDWRIGPGTWIGLKVWGAFLGDQQAPPPLADGFVYQKTGA